ncbi:MAG: PQQ-dependent sugar dehydrogenase [Myxococcota bacterium]
MRKLLVGVGILGLLGVGACFALPVVNGPMLAFMTGRGIEAPSEEVLRNRYQAAAGYTVELFAEDIQTARFMRFSPGGALLVSQPRQGRIVHVLPDGDGDGRSDGNRVLVEGLDRAHGLDFRDGHLYLAETGAIVRVPIADDGPTTIRTAGPIERVVEGIPPGGGHWTRTLRFGPDGGMYVHVGSSCNVCEEDDPRRAAILRYEPDGSGEEIYASGLRNSVGFDWQPGTNALYATDNGRDLLGDDYPPCELNLVERGGFYGWPYANAFGDVDPDFGEANPDKVEATISPVHGFRAHNAPLGITFLRHPDTPVALRGAALVALHGSWNRTRLDGYKVVSLHWENGEVEERDFLTGFEVDEDVIGRPVDVIEGPDGSIYVSDDYAGSIFRLHQGPATDAALADGSAAAGSHDGSEPPEAMDADAQAALGRAGSALFERNACGTCHLADEAAAGIVAKPLEDLGAKYSLEALIGFFLAPTPPMPAFELAEEERRALAVYLLSRFD